MEAVGYDMYIKLLNEAVNEQNGIEPVVEAECTVDLNISAHIPERYIESLPARLGVYKRIAAIENENQKMEEFSKKHLQDLHQQAVIELRS